MSSATPYELRLFGRNRRSLASQLADGEIGDSGIDAFVDSCMYLDGTRARRSRTIFRFYRFRPFPHVAFYRATTRVEPALLTSTSSLHLLGIFAAKSCHRRSK